LTQEQLFAYIASILAVAIAASMVVRGVYAPAVFMVLGAAFLVYWARRGNGRGER
jgi:hypothetical protein